jgi:hypothetical protein
LPGRRRGQSLCFDLFSTETFSTDDIAMYSRTATNPGGVEEITPDLPAKQTTWFPKTTA